MPQDTRGHIKTTPLQKLTWRNGGYPPHSLLLNLQRGQRVPRSAPPRAPPLLPAPGRRPTSSVTSPSNAVHTYFRPGSALPRAVSVGAYVSASVISPFSAAPSPPSTPAVPGICFPASGCPWRLGDGLSPFMGNEHAGLVWCLLAMVEYIVPGMCGVGWLVCPRVAGTSNV